MRKRLFYFLSFLGFLCLSIPTFGMTLEVSVIEITPEEIVIPAEGDRQGSFYFNLKVTGQFNEPTSFPLQITAQEIEEVQSSPSSISCPAGAIVTVKVTNGLAKFKVKQTCLDFLKSKGMTGESVSYNIQFTVGGVSTSIAVKFRSPVLIKVFKPDTEESWGKAFYDGRNEYSYTEEQITVLRETLETPIRFGTTATEGRFLIENDVLPFPAEFSGNYAWKEGRWVGFPTTMGFNNMYTEGTYAEYAPRNANGEVSSRKEGAYLLQEQAIWHRKALTGKWYVYYDVPPGFIPLVPDNADETFSVYENYTPNFPAEMTNPTELPVSGVGSKGSIFTGLSTLVNPPRGIVGVKGSFGNPEWLDPQHPGQIIPKTFQIAYVITSYEINVVTDQYDYLIIGCFSDGKYFVIYFKPWQTDPVAKYISDNYGNKVSLEIARATSSQNKSVGSLEIMPSMGNTAGSDGSPCVSCGSCYHDPVTNQDISFDCQVGDPININSLEYVESCVDMVVKGRGIDFEFKRTYKSRINYNGPLGHNWEHNYNMRVLPDPENKDMILILYDGTGRGDPYTKDLQGNYTPPPGHYRKIIKEEDGSLLLRNPNGTMCKFHALDWSPVAGKLTAIITRCGSRLAFEYNEDGQLIRVMDSYNRPINFYYEKNKLMAIEDFTGRWVDYQYDEDQNLVSVASPWAWHASGTWYYNIILYKYSKGFEDERLNHNLISVVASKDAYSTGEARVTNIYNSDDRLVSQKWGGTNLTGVPAGGTIFYARELQNEGIDPTNPDLPREVVTVTDRNGNITEFLFNCNRQLIKKEEKTRGIRPGDPSGYISQYKYTEAGLLQERIFPQGNRVVYQYDENNPDVFQAGNLLSVTSYPDARGGDQQYRKVTYQYEPLYNQVWKVTEARGNDPTYIAPNGGIATPQRYTMEYILDYFEGGLDTQGCTCGFTIRQLADKFGIDLSSIQNNLNQGDINGDGSFSICGNIIVRKYPKAQLRPDSPQISVEGGMEQIVETRITYNKFGQVSSIESPEGEVTEFLYYPERDPEGDGLNILTGTGATGQPYDSTTGGLLKEVIRDQNHSSRYRGTELPTQISTKYGYDARSNVRWLVDGRGVRTDVTVNELNLVIQVKRAADVSNATENGLTAYGYKTVIYHDYNNNPYRVYTEYRDGNNQNLPSWLDTWYIYDILDQLVQVSKRVDNYSYIYQEMHYDANGNLREVLSPTACLGTEPGNRVRAVYDERDFVYQVTGAPGMAEESTITYKYDRNGNLIETIDAQDNNGDGEGDTTTLRYDGFDRLVGTIDAAGNEAKRKYDPASNIIESEAWGAIGGITRNSNSTSGNVLLAKGYAFHDELSRVYRQEAELFVPSGVIPIRTPLLNEGDGNPNDGKVTSFMDYDRNSRVTFVTAASPASALEMSQFFYDGASRVIKAVDAEGNEVSSDYDKNSNVVKTTVVEKHATGRIPNETFVSWNVYDSLNRVSRTTSAIGQTRRFYYDSRNLLIKTSDAQGPEIPDPLGLYTQGNINADGNVTHFIQDGLGRTLSSIRELRINGQGGNSIDYSNPANPDGKIIENMLWDANSRMVSVSDDKGNFTNYAYDNLNRAIRTTFADGTTNRFEYNRDSQPVRITDNNGTVVNNTFDALGRPVQRMILPAQGVKGTTAQTFEYDGFSRLTRATDNNSPDTTQDDATVERKYDSLGRPVEEIQNGKVVSYNWTQAGDPVDLTYPNSRKLTYTLDKLNRLRTIANEGSSTPLLSYDYIAGRVIEKSYGNGTKLTMLNDAGNTDEGYDRLGRLVKMRHLKGTTLIAGSSYSYNRENMHTSQENLAYPALSEVYAMDSVYRVVDFKRGTLNATKTGITGTPVNTQTWQIDGVGNWANTTVDGATKTQAINNMNEYDSFNGLTQTHDENGNLTDDGKLLYRYDFANRIVEVTKKEPGNPLIARYTYDAMNRRISKYFMRSKSGQGGGEGEYASDGNTLLLMHFNEVSGEIRDSSGNNNHAPAPNTLKRGIEGLWDTKAVECHGTPIRVPSSSSLDNIAAQLTLEAFVNLQPPNCKGGIIHRESSFALEIDENFYLTFTLFTLDGAKTKKSIVRSNGPLPFSCWVHVAGVYDGSKIMVYVDGVRQSDVQSLCGNVKLTATRVFLGGNGFMGKLEEARISNCARTSFGGSGNGGTITQIVSRTTFYNGWQKIEERETVTENGQTGEEKIVRQFVDSAGIDEHLCVDYYNEAGTAVEKTYFYCANYRGDTVALTDASGNAVVKMAYSAYGQGFAIDEQGQLQPLGEEMIELATYLFQGRELDAETGNYYFRMRYYNAEMGRFLQRDPLGYMDSMGLYEAMGDSPYYYGDAFGNFSIQVQHWFTLKGEYQFVTTEVNFDKIAIEENNITKVFTPGEEYTLKEFDEFLNMAWMMNEACPEVQDAISTLQDLFKKMSFTNFMVKIKPLKETIDDEGQEPITDIIQEKTKVIGGLISLPSNTSSDDILHELVHCHSYQFEQMDILHKRYWELERRGVNAYELSVKLLNSLDDSTNLADIVNKDLKVNRETLAEIVRLNYLFNELSISKETYFNYKKNQQFNHPGTLKEDINEDEFKEIKNLVKKLSPIILKSK